MNWLFKISIDVFSREFISGLCLRRFGQNPPLTLDFFSGSTLLGSCTPDNAREDLVAQGIHPTGRCGFTFFLPDSIDWHSEGLITIRCRNYPFPLAKLEKRQVGTVVNASCQPSVLKLFARKKARLAEPVFFLHIPKTAGTSFNTFIQTHFTADTLTHIEAYEDQEYARFAQNYDYIAGHLRIDQVAESFPRERFQWWTLLREPFAHLHSHLNWLRGVGAQDGTDFFATHHPEFKRLARRFGQKKSLTYDELQTLVDSLVGVLAHMFDNCQTRYLVSGQKRRIQTADMDEALANMSCFHGVGITEEFRKFKRHLLSSHNIDLKLVDHRLNKAKFSPLYDHRDPVAREIVLPLVFSDLALYEAALVKLRR